MIGVLKKLRVVNLVLISGTLFTVCSGGESIGDNAPRSPVSNSTLNQSSLSGPLSSEHCVSAQIDAGGVERRCIRSLVHGHITNNVVPDATRPKSFTFALVRLRNIKVLIIKVNRSNNKTLRRKTFLLLNAKNLSQQAQTTRLRKIVLLRRAKISAHKLLQQAEATKLRHAFLLRRAKISTDNFFQQTKTVKLQKISLSRNSTKFADNLSQQAETTESSLLPDEIPDTSLTKKQILSLVSRYAVFRIYAERNSLTPKNLILRLGHHIQINKNFDFSIYGLSKWGKEPQFLPSTSTVRKVHGHTNQVGVELEYKKDGLKTKLMLFHGLSVKGKLDVGDLGDLHLASESKNGIQASISLSF